jgi:hypothetical protein
VADGLTISLDGTIAYTAQNTTVVGYRISDGMQVYSSGAIFPSLDGLAIVSSFNSLNGQIVVNDNNGSIYLLDPVSNTFVTIATGGTRGDFAAADINNGTIFLGYSDVVGRLACGVGCAIGSPFSTADR